MTATCSGVTFENRRRTQKKKEKTQGKTHKTKSKPPWQRAAAPTSATAYEFQ